MLGVMALVFVLVALATPVELGPRYLTALYCAFLELSVVTAVAVFLSTFASPVLTAVFTLALFVVGHVSGDLKTFGETLGGAALRQATRAAYYALPNLEIFNVRGAVVHGDPVAPAQVGLATLHATAWVALLLLGAGAIFRRKELK